MRACAPSLLGCHASVHLNPLAARGGAPPDLSTSSPARPCTPLDLPQVVREEGAYANGRATLELLPPEVYGPGCEKQFSLRRLEAVLGEAEQAEHLAKEMLKVGGC